MAIGAETGGPGMVPESATANGGIEAEPSAPPGDKTTPRSLADDTRNQNAQGLEQDGTVPPPPSLEKSTVDIHTGYTTVHSGPPAQSTPSLGLSLFDGLTML